MNIKLVCINHHHVLPSIVPSLELNNALYQRYSRTRTMATNTATTQTQGSTRAGDSELQTQSTLPHTVRTWYGT